MSSGAHGSQAATAAPVGKVKGLFCYIPSHLVFPFATYGLGIQPTVLPGAGSAAGGVAAGDKAEVQRQQRIQAALVDDVNGRIFRTVPWYYYPVSAASRDNPTPAASPGKESSCAGTGPGIRSMVSDPGYAERTLRESMRGYPPPGPGSPISPSQSQSQSQSPSPSQYLRFYRHSTPCNYLSRPSSSPPEDGVDGDYYLALCRVFLHRVKTLPPGSPGTLSDRDILEIGRGNYDAIYNQQT